MENGGLHSAAASGDLITLQKLLSNSSPAFLDNKLVVTTGKGSAGRKRMSTWRLLLRAKRTGSISNTSNLGSTNLLLPRIDPNAYNTFGMTPLHAAAFHGHPVAIKLLLQHGAQANHPSAVHPHFTFPLHLAIIRQNLEAVRVLLYEGGADTRLRDGLGKSAIEWAQDLVETLAKEPGIDAANNHTKAKKILETLRSNGSTTDSESHDFYYDSSARAVNVKLPRMQVQVDDDSASARFSDPGLLAETSLKVLLAGSKSASEIWNK